MALVLDRDLEISTKTSQKVEEPNISELHANISMICGLTSSGR